jgi:glycosyltransferase involved in cell wall biosynthesis
VLVDVPLIRRNQWGVLDPPPLEGWRPTRTVSVIIPAYQCQELVDLALAALSRQSYPPDLLEVVVADDGSAPPIRLPALAPPHSRLVRVPDHSGGWGRAAAVHTAAAASDGEILHWLDADVVPFPSHVAAQARWHHLLPDAVTLGYKRFAPPGPWPSPAEVATGRVEELFPPERTEPHGYVEDLIDSTDRLRAADHLAFRAHVGATAAVRRDLYREAGGVCTELRLGEDSELGYRLAQAGAVFIPEPAAGSWHLGPSNMMRDGDRLRAYNRPFLADLMPHPRWLRGAAGGAGRSWRVPLVTAVVVADGPYQRVQECVDRLLASDEHDLVVRLVAGWDALTDGRRRLLEDPLLERRLLAATYRSDPRVALVGEAPESAFPSPYLLLVPPQVGVRPDTVRRMVHEADRHRVGLLRLTPPGSGAGATPPSVELWRTAAVSRARRRLAPDRSLADMVTRVWGGRWASGADFGIVRLPDVDLPEQVGQATATSAAPAHTASLWPPPTPAPPTPAPPPPAPPTPAPPAAPAPAPPTRASPTPAPPAVPAPGPVRSAPGSGGGERVQPVPVAGLRSLVRATWFVGRLAAARAWRRIGRAVGPTNRTLMADRPRRGGLVQALRRRVRLRTRLRRAREAWRRSRRLPAWSERPRRVERTGPPDRIVVATAGELRGRFDGSSRSVQVVVEDWRPPFPGWSGRPLPLPGLLDQRVTVPRAGRGTATVTVSLAEPLPLSQVVAAVLPVVEPLRRSPPGVPTATEVTELDERARPVVDATAANPKGRDRYGPELPAGVLGFAPDGSWEITTVPDGTPVVAGGPFDPLDDRRRAVLVQLGLVTWDPAAEPVGSRGGSARYAGTSPDQLVHRPAAAQLLAQLAMTGVVLHAPAPSPSAAPPGHLAARDLLAPELAALIADPPPGDDPLDWELRSVRQRRVAIRHHAAELATPPVTALLVTKRPQLALRTVVAMAGQTYPELEIVVGLHGAREPAGLREAAAGRPLRVLDLPSPHNLGEALVASTAAVGGQLVTKVDDDDRYGPEHVWDLVLADHYSSATVVGKGADFVHLEPEDVTVRRRMAGEFYTDVVAGGTLTLRGTDLAALGGWPRLPRHVDRALLDRVIADGGLVYRTHPLGFIYTRHGDGHTWQADVDYFLRDARRRWAGLPPYREFGTDG